MKYPEKIHLRGRRINSLIEALSQFPKNTTYTLRIEDRLDYNLDRVFTLEYDKDFKEVTIRQIQ